VKQNQSRVNEWQRSALGSQIEELPEGQLDLSNQRRMRCRVVIPTLKEDKWMRRDGEKKKKARVEMEKRQRKKNRERERNEHTDLKKKRFVKVIVTQCCDRQHKRLKSRVDVVHDGRSLEHRNKT
jgi:hypothetical protein